jgi:proteasome lid subunit RPN8/RPN11
MPYNVTIDGKHSQQFCDRAHAKSCGKWDYVGDWHSHPGVCVKPSEGDRLAMSLMARTPGLVSNPVSLIYSAILKYYRVYEWQVDSERLVRVKRCRTQSRS